MRLNDGERHILRLVAAGKDDENGWAKVSAPVFPLVNQMPKELVEIEQVEAGGGRARLTQEGTVVLKWL